MKICLLKQIRALAEETKIVQTWDANFEQKLLVADSYRKFLALFFHPNPEWKRPRKLTYQEFATRAGFSSKSFMADIIANRKRLTPSSFEKTVAGLKLSPRWEEYLKCLVAKEEMAFLTPKYSTDYYARKLSELKIKIKNRSERKPQIGNSPLMEVLLQPYFPEVYAGLGTVEKGTTLRELQVRTGFNTKALEKILLDLEKVGIVKSIPKTGRYLPVPSAIEAEKLNDEILFEKDFIRALQKAQGRFKSQAQSEESLFMTQTFSVKKSKLAGFRNSLAQLIIEFADDAEAAEGDAIAEICIGFTHNSKP